MATKYPNEPEQPERPLDFRDVVGMDPAANWLLGVARQDFLPSPGETPIPFLLELLDEAAAKAFDDLPPIEQPPPPDEKDPPLEQDDDPGNGALVIRVASAVDFVAASRLLPVVASLRWFTRLIEDGDPRFRAFREANKRIVLSSPVTLPEEWLSSFPDFPERAEFVSLDDARIEPPPRGWRPGAVVTAVIDDGVAFAHERFRNDKGSRVHAFWNMNVPFPVIPANPPTGPVPAVVPGELGKVAIDKLLTDHASGGPVDEDALYAEAGLIDFRDSIHKTAAWRVAHGTHVLDLAAGYAPADNIENRPIIAVQLPTPIVAQTTGDMLDAFIWLATLYVIDRADRIASGRPLVINTSFGLIGGSHDATGMLSENMDDAIAAGDPETQIVLPAGNSQLSRCGALIDLGEKTEETFDLIVQPDDRTQSIVEVWMPAPTPAANRMRMTVTVPGAASHVIEEVTAAIVPLLDMDGGVAGQLQVQVVGGRRVFRMSLHPTERPQPDAGPLAPSGRWKLAFRRLKPMKEPAHAWVQRDDSIYGFPQRGRQSYFDHPRYVRFDEQGFEVTDDEHPEQAALSTPIKRKSLLNPFAAGARVITAGGYRDRDCRIARYSAGGPNTPPETGTPPPRKPDALLPSDGSKAHPGVLAAGSRSGARVAMSGTSVAAPQLARHVADMLVNWAAADRDAVAVKAKGSPVCPAPDPPDPPDRAGWGRLPRLDPPPEERYDPA